MILAYALDTVVRKSGLSVWGQTCRLSHNQFYKRHQKGCCSGPNIACYSTLTPVCRLRLDSSSKYSSLSLRVLEAVGIFFVLGRISHLE